MGAQIKDGKIQHQHIHLDEKFERRIMVVTGQETKMSLQQSIQKYLLIIFQRSSSSSSLEKIPKMLLEFLHFWSFKFLFKIFVEFLKSFQGQNA